MSQLDILQAEFNQISLDLDRLMRRLVIVEMEMETLRAEHESDNKTVSGD
jgi:hypothetical protein